MADQKIGRRGFLGGLAASLALVSTGAQAGGTCQAGPNGTGYCTVGIQSHIAHVAAAKQINTQWCWAACIETVFRYYGHPVNQVRIVKEVFGNIQNMPGMPHHILGALNRQWVDDRGQRFRCRGDALSANLLTAIDDLTFDRPLIVGTLGHAMVLTAMSYRQNRWTGAKVVDQMVVRDPWPGKDMRTLTRPEAFNIQFLARIQVS